MADALWRVAQVHIYKENFNRKEIREVESQRKWINGVEIQNSEKVKEPFDRFVVYFIWVFFLYIYNIT